MAQRWKRSGLVSALALVSLLGTACGSSASGGGGADTAGDQVLNPTPSTSPTTTSSTTTSSTTTQPLVTTTTEPLVTGFRWAGVNAGDCVAFPLYTTTLQDVEVVPCSGPFDEVVYYIHPTVPDDTGDPMALPLFCMDRIGANRHHVAGLHLDSGTGAAVGPNERDELITVCTLMAAR